MRGIKKRKVIFSSKSKKILLEKIKNPHIFDDGEIYITIRKITLLRIVIVKIWKKTGLL